MTGATTTTTPRRSLAARLDSMPMHLVVASALTVLIVVAIVLSAVGVLTFEWVGIAVTAVVAIGVSALASLGIGLLRRRPAHLPSALITGQIITLLTFPGTAPDDLVTTASVAVVAALVKSLVVWRGRAFLNPAAAGVVVAAAVLPAFGLLAAPESWWVASEPMFWVLVPLAALVLARTRLLLPGAILVVVATAALTVVNVQLGAQVGPALWSSLAQYPTIFLAGFMFSEPITLPPRRAQRVAVAALVGLLCAAPLALGVAGLHPVIGYFALGQAAALLLGNVVSFALGARRGTVLELRGSERTGDYVELRFAAIPPLRHRAGQWVELSLPHRSDPRGERRVFSVASPPGADEVHLGVQVREPLSTFKSRLLALAPGDTIAVTREGGDFVTSTGASQLMIAAGIGVTPFLSQLRAGADGGGQGTVLVLLLRAGEQVPFAGALAACGARVIVVTSGEAPTWPHGGTSTWEHAVGRLDADMLRQLVPDAADREVLVSGSPDQVRRLRQSARDAGARRVLVDAFSGY